MSKINYVLPFFYMTFQILKLVAFSKLRFTLKMLQAKVAFSNLKKGFYFFISHSMFGAYEVTIKFKLCIAKFIWR